MGIYCCSPEAGWRSPEETSSFVENGRVALDRFGPAPRCGFFPCQAAAADNPLYPPPVRLEDRCGDPDRTAPAGFGLKESLNNSMGFIFVHNNA
jgi:hypothetical protein